MAGLKQIYQHIKEFIIKDINFRSLGEPLPSEVEYSVRYKVSRTTVRKAVEELVAVGVVKKIPGKGLFVSDPSNIQNAGNLLFVIPYSEATGLFFNMLNSCIDHSNKCGFHYKIINHYDSVDRLNAFKKIDVSDYSGVILSLLTDLNDDKELLDIIEEKNIPHVLLVSTVAGHNSSYVVSDDFRGGYLQGECLIKNGHTNILYITRFPCFSSVRNRKLGFIKALEDSGIILSENNFIDFEDDDDVTSESIAKRISEKNIPYTAICCFDDLSAIECYNALTNIGKSVPEDVSILGYNNSRLSEILKVPLSTISLPVHEMGHKAAEMLINNIKKKTPLEKVIMDVSLVERQTVMDISGK